MIFAVWNHARYQEHMISQVYETIANIMLNLYCYPIWYHLWYHSCASMISSSYDIIGLDILWCPYWYHLWCQVWYLTWFQGISNKVKTTSQNVLGRALAKSHLATSSSASPKLAVQHFSINSKFWWQLHSQFVLFSKNHKKIGGAATTSGTSIWGRFYVNSLELNCTV